MTAAPDDPMLIYETKKTPDWPRWGEEVTTIHLGNQDGETVAITLPEDLAERFPALTCLRLWNLQLTGLPELPASLRELEVRRCAQLQGLRNLPVGLEVLVLEDLPGITELPGEAKFPSLWDLSLGGSTGIRAEGINEFLRRCSAVRWLDLARCTQMEGIRQWPTGLERIVLNDCTKLAVLPERWPAKLRRLELRNATAIRRLPAFRLQPGRKDAWPDYVDLSGMSELKEIGIPRGTRTLYLHGSGILMPPASEHGRTRDENVAQRTVAYFSDITEFGKGEVKRCKLLMLGNGGAGKTSLSLALKGISGKKAGELGSTHGVQFWEFEQNCTVGNFAADVRVHTWDFGGQEIYHQTHRLFMATGAVFLVLWNPEQDHGTPPVTEAGYQDIWRPLRYWIDFIHLACPWKPRIAVVCSGCTSISPEVRARFESQLPDRKDEIRLFAVDSWAMTGQLDDLRSWLGDTIGEVVNTQGTAVPSYWEIAQDLVGSWLPRLNPDDPATPLPAKYNAMSMTGFSDHLGRYIEDMVAACHESVTPEMAKAVTNKSFELNPDRLRRTLEFLTNSGWLYWNDKLFDERVIIGQHWALDGIYAVLDRSKESRVYEELEKSKGQFTRRDLDEWVWGHGEVKKGHSVETQNLLLSFMEQAGVCFRLVSEQDSYWQEAVYKVFMHLPFEEELYLISEFMERHPTSNREPVSISRSLLHQGHWNEWLRTMGTIYGTDGKYAQNGFALRTGEGQDVCVTMDFTRDENGKPAGLGGTITVRVAGERAGDLLKALVAHIESFLPTEGVTNASAHSGRSDGSTLPAGDPPNRVRLFVSYTWNPEGTDHAGNGYIDEPVATDYEAPVNAIEEALMPYAHIVKFLRDSKEIKAGQLITEFMKQIKNSEKVLIVYGDKYWRSPYCVYELTEGLRSKGLEKGRFTNVFRFVSMNGMKLAEDSHLGVIRKFWQEYKAGSFPILMKKVATARGLKAAVADLVENSLPVILDFADLHREWTPKKPDETIRWVKDFLGIKP